MAKKRTKSATRKVVAAPANGKSKIVYQVLSLVAGIGLGMALALELRGLSRSDFTSAGPLFTLLGRILAMVGTYAMILTLFLIARIPLLEREVGLDKTVSWHRKLAPYSLFAIGFHIIFTVLGYSITDKTSALHELWSLVSTTRWILPALAAFIMMLVAGVTSYKRVRSKMAYETWWVIHLYFYLAVVLAYAHQVSLGNAFIGHETATKAWLALTVTSVASVIIFRWIKPLVHGLRHQLIVHAVVRESADIVSVWVKGRNVRKLKASGGQFFSWRFMVKDLWWQAHPYSLSAPPDGKYLRITVKDLGDHSKSLGNIKPGTRVMAEGPYGVFTADKRHSDRVVLIAGGVGVTPIRAVLEELPHNAQVDVLYRARSEEDVVLRRELDELGKRPNTNIRYLVGTRHEHPMDARTLLRLVPHIASCDVYMCGPHALTETVSTSLEIIGLDRKYIHEEAFAF